MEKTSQVDFGVSQKSFVSLCVNKKNAYTNETKPLEGINGNTFGELNH